VFVDVGTTVKVSVDVNEGDAVTVVVNVNDCVKEGDGVAVLDDVNEADDDDVCVKVCVPVWEEVIS
jgi:multidrug efflux pump subunit AcrA (membrane-fusion protein)